MSFSSCQFEVMEFQGSTAEKCKQTKDSNALPLISGLPDDIALLCLARVPRKYHHVFRCVSRRWKALVCSDDFHSCRLKNNMMESWVYVLCKDGVKGNCIYVLDPDRARRCWKLLQVIPPRCAKWEGMSFEALGSKLYLMGGCSWNKDATSEVHWYDVATNKWEEAIPMPTARSYFASATLNEKLFVTSGVEAPSGSQESLDIYDPHSKVWSSHELPMLIPDIVKLIAFDGRVYTIHKAWNFYYAGVYDPQSNMWKRANDDIASQSGPTVDVDGTLYMLDETSLGTRLMMWQEDVEEWVPLGRLAHQLTRPPCQLVAVGRNIFVIGQGLSTVVIDIDRAATVEGMLVSSSFHPKLDSDVSVIGCTTIAI